jgi:hypothetical protein
MDERRDVKTDWKLLSTKGSLSLNFDFMEGTDITRVH